MYIYLKHEYLKMYVFTLKQIRRFYKKKFSSKWLKNLTHPAYLCPLGSEPLTFSYVFFYRTFKKNKSGGIFIKCYIAYFTVT